MADSTLGKLRLRFLEDLMLDSLGNQETGTQGTILGWDLRAWLKKVEQQKFICEGMFTLV